MTVSMLCCTTTLHGLSLYSTMVDVDEEDEKHQPKAVSTSSNMAYGVVAHGSGEGGQSHTYEMVALNQPPPPSTARAATSSSDTGPETETVGESAYEVI